MHLGQRESQLGRVEIGHTRAGQREEQEGGREAEGRVGRPESEEKAVTRDRIQVHCHKGVNLVRETREAGREESAGTSGRR